jgi:subtilisin family serine protease
LLGASASAALLLCGCTSLRTSKAVLVKVPSTEIREGEQRGDDWHFEHVLKAPKDSGQWYVAWNNKKPIRTSPLHPYWHTLLARAPEIGAAALKALSSYPVLIEPNRTFSTMSARPRLETKSKQADEAGQPMAQGRADAQGSAPRLVYHKSTSPAWDDARISDPERPGHRMIDPAWHLGNQYSQLALARERVGEPERDKPRIRIGHLDNGLDATHPATPEHLISGTYLANVVGLLEFAQDRSRKDEGEKPPARGWRRKPLTPEETGGTHGMGTIGLLAGGRIDAEPKSARGVKIGRFEPKPGSRYAGYLGGAPQAEVVPLRVAPWVVSISTGELAYAIDYASRVMHCDVLSMSHGGAPTQAWADAVNAAYERGTAMFAAESDFFSLSFDPIPPNGLIVPASPVYPAAFRRVVGVTGVTRDGRSYGRNTLWNFLRAPQSFLSWALRGSYGADGTSTVLYRPRKDPDQSQVRRQGWLRPHPIAAYSPNVPWLTFIRKKDTAPIPAVDLDGAGTSAATPQVAAAAALWLQYHRHEFTPEEWNSKDRPEAVYYALLRSAQRKRPGEADRYLGAGLLKANAALDISYAEIKRHKPPPHPATEYPPCADLYYDPVGNDYFDAERSFLSVLGLQTRREVERHFRAGLVQKAIPADQPAAALQQLYYNTLLLRAWHSGKLPQGPRGNGVNPELWRAAGSRAERTLAVAR